MAKQTKGEVRFRVPGRPDGRGKKSCKKKRTAEKNFPFRAFFCCDGARRGGKFLACILFGGKRAGRLRWACPYVRAGIPESRGNDVPCCGRRAVWAGQEPGRAAVCRRNGQARGRKNAGCGGTSPVSVAEKRWAERRREKRSSEAVPGSRRRPIQKGPGISVERPGRLPEPGRRKTVRGAAACTQGEKAGGRPPVAAFLR